MPKVGGRRVNSSLIRRRSIGRIGSTIRKPRRCCRRVCNTSYEAFVFKKGKVSNTMKELVHDYRNCMYPNTAMKLEDSSRLKLKDFVKSARQFGVTHLVAYHRYRTSTLWF